MTCPTCHAPDCPHAAAPVTPEGELSRLRRENERLKGVEGRYEMLLGHLAGFQEARQAEWRETHRLEVENAALRRRLETLEPQREM